MGSRECCRVDFESCLSSQAEFSVPSLGLYGSAVSSVPNLGRSHRFGAIGKELECDVKARSERASLPARSEG